MVVLGLDSTGFNTGINSATGKTSAFAKLSDKTFKAIAMAAKIGMLAVSAAFIKGVIDAGKFEKALANVATMLDKTTMPLMKDFKKSILDMSEAYGESTDALAKGLYDILSASIPAAQALDVLEVSAQAAKAGLTDTGVAADAITTLMNSFQDATKDAGFYSDILFATVKFGKTTFAELAPVIGNVAKLMQVAGGSAQDMAGMLAIMTRNGIKTRVAVTSLRGVVNALIKPSEALTKELGGMTVKADGFRAVMEKVGSLPATDLAEMFPNVRALTGVVVAAKDLGAEVEKINDLMADGSPTAAAFAIQTDTLAFIWSQFKATLKATSITIGDQLLPVVREILSGMTEWLKENREGFAEFAKNTVEAITKVIKVIFDMKEVLFGLGAALLAVMVVQKVTTAMAALGIATSVSLGPIAAIAAAVGLLIAGFIKLKKELKDEKEEQQFLNDAMKGTLQTAEDYNDAIDIQEKKMQAIIDAHDDHNGVLAAGSLVTLDQMAIAQEAYEANLKHLRDEQNLMITNAIKRQQVEEAEKAAAEDKATQAQIDFLETIARETEIKRIADKKVATERTNLAMVNGVRDALLEASLTEQQKYEQEKAHLLEIGDLTEKEVIAYLAIQYPEAAEIAKKASKALYDTEVLSLKEKGKLNNEAIKTLKEKYPDAYADVEEAAMAFYESEDEMETDWVDNVVVATTEKFKLKWTEALATVKDVFTQVFSALTGTVNQYFANMFSKLDEEGSQRKKDAKATIKDEDELALALEAIDKDMAQKRYALELKQFKTTKALNIAQALMNTAEAVSKALTLIWPLNLIIAALVGGLGAAQVGLIAGQTAPAAPAFIKGGVVDKMIAGGLFAGKPGIDTNNIAVTSGEYIMPPQQTIDNMDELESMRSGGGGGKNIVVTPMPLNIEMEGRNIFSGMVEFMTDESDLGSFRINPKVLGVTT